MDKHRFVITGCGRSGTGYMAEQLNGAGLKCGHESVFKINGEVNWQDYQGDSSWLAAPHIASFPSDLPVVHIIRDPLKVANSFYRIGLFSKLGWRNFAINPSLKFLAKNYLFNPRRIFHRFDHVTNLRQIIRQNTNCLQVGDEIQRIWCYWVEWNLLIEENAKVSKVPYLRIHLEDLDNNWEKVSEHIGYELRIQKQEPVNTKSDYPHRDFPNVIVPEAVTRLARRYGYEY